MKNLTIVLIAGAFVCTALPQSSYAQTRGGISKQPVDNSAADRAREAEAQRQRDAAAQQQREQERERQRQQQQDAENRRQEEQQRAYQQQQEEREREAERDREREYARDREREAERERQQEAEADRWRQEREAEEAEEEARADRERARIQREKVKQEARDRETAITKINKNDGITEIIPDRSIPAVENTTAVVVPVKDVPMGIPPTIFLVNGDSLTIPYEPGMPAAATTTVPPLMASLMEVEFETGTNPTSPNEEATIAPPGAIACPVYGNTTTTDIYPPSSLIAAIECGLNRLQQYAMIADWGDYDFEQRFDCELMSVKSSIDLLYASNWDVSAYYCRWLNFNHLYDCNASARPGDRDRAYEMAQFFQIKADYIEKLMIRLPEDPAQRENFMRNYATSPNAGARYLQTMMDFEPQEVENSLRYASSYSNSWKRNNYFIYLSNFLDQYRTSGFVRELNKKIASNYETATQLSNSNPEKALQLAENAFYFNRAVGMIGNQTAQQKNTEEATSSLLSTLNPGEVY